MKIPLIPSVHKGLFQEENANLASFLILSATFTLNILNLVYLIMMAYLLTPEDFGLLSAIIALYAILAIPNGSMRTVTAKRVSSILDHSVYEIRSTFHTMLKSYFPFFFGIGLLVIFFSPIVSTALKGQSIVIVLISMNFIISAANPIISGIFQGSESYYKFATVILLFSSIKLILGVLFVFFSNFGIDGAILSLVITGFIVPIICGILVYPQIRKKETDSQTIDISKSFSLWSMFPVLLTDLGFLLFFNIDSILIRVFFSAVESGYYAVVSIIGKAIFYTATSICLVMIPKVVKTRASKGRTDTLFFNSFLLFIGLSAVILIIISSTSKILITVLFGLSYLPASDYVTIFLIISLLFGIVSVLANYNIAMDDYILNIPLLLGMIIEICGIIIFHDSFNTVFLVMFISVIFMILAMIGLKIIQKKRGLVFNFRKKGD